MMSELGLVYFLVRAASRKTVKVWLVSLRPHSHHVWAAPYLERNLVRRRRALLHALEGAMDELLRMRLRVEHVVGRQRVEYTLQPRSISPVQEELLPEAIREVRVVVVPEQRLVQANDLGLEDLRP
jgi:hypothetical protein